MGQVEAFQPLQCRCGGVKFTPPHLRNDVKFGVMFDDRIASNKQCPTDFLNFI